MEKFLIITLSISFSIIVGIVGFWLKTAHKEIKVLMKELTDYTNELKQLIVGIETQIERGIEADINDNKEDIKTLFSKVNKLEAQIASIKQKLSI